MEMMHKHKLVMESQLLLWSREGAEPAKLLAAKWIYSGKVEKGARRQGQINPNGSHNQVHFLPNAL